MTKDAERKIGELYAMLMYGPETWITWEQFEKKTEKVYSKEQKRWFKKNFGDCLRQKGQSVMVSWTKYVEAHKPVKKAS